MACLMSDPGKKWREILERTGQGFSKNSIKTGLKCGQ